MIKTYHLFLLFLFCSASLFAQQVGGSYTFAFLDIPASARVAALGGTFISAKDNDLNCALQNPSLLNRSMNNNLLFNSVSYFDGVSFGDVAYSRDFKKAGTFMANMHYANYGQIQEADVTGQALGTFHAADYNFNVGWGYKLNDLLSIGATLKGIYSNYYYDHSTGVGVDIAGTFYDSTSQITIALVARNYGSQLKTYTKDDREPLPSEIDAAISKRLVHTPFRFNLTYRHLEKFDLTYTDVNDVSQVDPITGKSVIYSYGFYDMLERHLIFATEILLTQNFHLRAAYNFQRRQELSVDTSPGMVGMSFGFGIKISKFNISYGYGKYHLAAAANHFSLSTNLSDFLKKKSSASD